MPPFDRVDARAKVRGISLNRLVIVATTLLSCTRWS